MFFFSKNINANDKRTLHEFSFNDVDGKKYLLSQHKNKVVLLVNVASQCGFTKQYTDLQALWDKYKSKNFVIIGVPSNDFGNQEPGTENEISTFCKKNYGVTFPIAMKSSVKKGKEQNEVFKWLSDSTLNGWNTHDPSWNFGKYLVDENGKLLNYYSSGVDPMDEKILNALK